MFAAFMAAGFAGGLLGGMGMGGGTVLIPILSIFFGTSQISAQAINLISFVPMAVVALIIHFKNRLVVTKGLWIIVLAGAVFAFMGALLASAMSGDTLKKLFGGFLTVLSIIQIFSVIRKRRVKRR